MKDSPSFEIYRHAPHQGGDYLVASWRLEKQETFCACAGTRGVWDKLYLDIKQVQAVVRQLSNL